jgi:thiol:disulfide interchange protein
MVMRRSSGTLLVLLAIVGVLSVLRVVGGGSAPRPAFFSDGLTLAEAETQARASGRTVLVLATADWCGPCQSLKRGALSDARVAGWVGAHAAPVYLDLTAPGPDEREAAQRLAIGPIPTIVLIRDGREVARHVGAVSADRLLGWLQQAGGG